MDELGHVLREARETMGLTVAEVEAKTRINRRFIEALEEGAYHLLPTPVHARGFLRNYARFLNLDPQPLLERYDQTRKNTLEPLDLTQRDAPQQTIPEPPLLRESQPFFDPVNFQLADGGKRDPQSLVRFLIIVALIVFLGLVISRFVPLIRGGEDGTRALTEGINEVLQSILNSDEADALSPEENGSSGVMSPTEEGTPHTGGSSPNLQTPEVLPTRPSLGTLEVINLRLEISERTWMEAVIDGDVRFSGFATRGDVFEWTAQNDARLLTGNAHGIIATINDVELGRLGGFQEAREEYWQTTQ